MLLAFSKIAPLLRKPGQPDVHVELTWDDDKLVGANSGGVEFPVQHNQPVLINFNESVLSADWFSKDMKTYSPIGARKNSPRQLKGILFGTNAVSAKNFKAFRDLLIAGHQSASERPLLLMIGAATPGIGTDTLYSDTTIDQIAFDIYPSPLTHFVADGHGIPLPDKSVDGVCIQAVLEHVLTPEKVVSEITRILKDDGYVYAETPFMQQIHEGAYDFTRFTELGHRWLWRDFTALHRGPMGGPGLSLYWSAKYFFRGITNSKTLGNILSLPFAIFPLCDRFIRSGHAIDGANGVFFLGRKSSRPTATSEIISQYLGAQ